jgi:hypothetical protein
VLWDTSEVSGLSLGEGSTKITYPTTTTQTGATPTPLSSPLPIPIAVWAKLMESSKGRDKVLVRYIIPYSHSLQAYQGGEEKQS